MLGNFVVTDTTTLFSPMVVYTCKKCGTPNSLTPHAFWDITDFGAKCEKCETINTVTIVKGELKK
jgi:hypothetical protein